MSLQKDISTALWFAVHPGLYPQLGRSLRRRLLSPARPADEAAQAREWCAQRAVTTADALEQLTGASTPEPVRERHAYTFDAARAADARVEAVPRNGEAPALGEAPATGPHAPSLDSTANLDLLYWLCEHTAARRVVETGVGQGWSSLAILLSLAQRDGDLLSTDMPHPTRCRTQVGAVVPPWLHMHWAIIRLADGEAVPKALRRWSNIDLCHYDSDRSYDGRVLTYPRLWDALRPGGMLVSNHVDDDLAFREFAERFGVEPVIVADHDGRTHAGVLVKQ